MTQHTTNTTMNDFILIKFKFELIQVIISTDKSKHILAIFIQKIFWPIPFNDMVKFCASDCKKKQKNFYKLNICYFILQNIE